MKKPRVTRSAAPAPGFDRVLAWFASRGWTPFRFQLDAWRAYLEGRSGLVHAPTGMGKSLSVWMGPVIESLDEQPIPGPALAERPASRSRASQRHSADPIRVLWITPMRALATDTVKSLVQPLADLGLGWTVEKRTGDTSASLKLKQRERLPTCLVTTPESLTLLLSYPAAREQFASLRCIVVDEWHELLSSKRGTQTELALARLRAWNPALRTWGLSATLGNTREALDVLLGSRDPARHRATTAAEHEASAGVRSRTPDAALVPGETIKEINIATILPDDAARFPWSGHLGLRLLPKVLGAIERCGTSLLFTNTRSQAEVWYRAISEARPEWLGRVAIHHGSIDREVRDEVEKRLDQGRLLCVVCTSSLDLGVDFSPVEQVIQVGSPKGVARLMQRAGRSGHQPGAPSTVVCVPTNAMELLEFAAARDAIRQSQIERRDPICKPLDVLAQHLVTIGIAGGFDAAAMLEEVRGAWSYRNLTDEEWRWVMEFVTTGGPSLKAYPQYARLIPAPAGAEHASQKPGPGRYRAASTTIERNHRLGIGTITSDASVRVAYTSGRTLGTIEEGFISKLSPGDRFVFAGQHVELIRVHQMTAHVAKAKKGGAMIARWDGGRSPLSTQLAWAVRRRIDASRRAIDAPGHAAVEAFDCPEMAAARPLLSLQARWSRLPAEDELLLETIETRDGHHVFLFPFEGRLVQEGLGALVAHRLARRSPRSLSVTPNDSGIEWLSPTPLPDDEASWREALSIENLLEDLMSCLNSTELTRRQFRDIARIAGLIIPSFPGQGGKSTRQVQASSSLFFDVFSEFDPGNMLLDQARREVLEQQLELRRLRDTLTRLSKQRLVIVRPERLTPFSFPLWAEGIRTQQVTSERWSDRVQRMAAVLEQEADGGSHAEERARNPAKRARSQPRTRR